MIIEFYPNPTSKFPTSTNGFPTAPSEVVKAPKGQSWYSSSSPTAFEVAQSIKKHISVTEFKRRNEIVMKAFKECTYHKHDVVFPHNLEAYDRHGMCRVLGICSNYGEMEEKEWPTSDCPFIVHVSPFKPDGMVFNDTVGYFKKERPTI